MSANGSPNDPPIRKLRAKAGLTQEGLARLADCSTSTVRIAERGWVPSAAMRHRLAAVLGCSADELNPLTPLTDKRPSGRTGAVTTPADAAADNDNGTA
jgi:transcriptional regulator with XRE-family HTH domain